MNYKTALCIIPVALMMIAAGIDLANLENYSNQGKPVYIVKDNSGPNGSITNKGATLGRVLFYDKKLSVNNQIACASCHQQQFAFGDTARLSQGVTTSLTSRHAMRLVNARFSTETKFFWDERAASLELQTTQPIQNHDEMGYSGINGDQSMSALINKLSQITYYSTLFTFVYGDATITEVRIQNALAQFIRSMQSFDSKFDVGLAQANNLNAPFQNFTTLENQGKALFLAPPNQGGAGCQGCHRAPEFDIDPNTKNNGVIVSATNLNVNDFTNTRAPSLRDVFNASGQLNGPLMHNGRFNTIEQVINHYNQVPLVPANNNLDPRLAGPGGSLQLSQAQKNALAAFIKTLSGNNIYTDAKWSNPFDANGNLESNITSVTKNFLTGYSLYPNPVSDALKIEIADGNYNVKIMGLNGEKLFEANISGSESIDLSYLVQGVYIIKITNLTTGAATEKKLVKN